MKATCLAMHLVKIVAVLMARSVSSLTLSLSDLTRFFRP